MHHPKQLTVLAAAAILTLGLGAAPRPAEAGACKDLGLGKKCVERGDIKKKAIDSKRVKNGSLTGADFKDGGLSGKDVRDGGLTGAHFQDGSLTGADVQDGGLTGAHFQDDTLTGADVQDGGITNADLAAGTVTVDDIFARTLVVSPAGDGSDTTANGQNLLDAVTALGGVSPPLGAANPWTLKLEPGVYDVGASSVDLPSHVELIGTGQGVTTITGNVDALSALGPGVVNMTNNTAIRDVTVINPGGGSVSFAHAITVQGGPIRVADVTAQASNAFSSGIAITAPSGCGELTLTDVTATAGVTSGDSIGADLRCSAAVATNLTATGEDKGLVSVGTTFVRDSVLDGTTASAEQGGGTLNIAHSQLLESVSGTVKCFGAYDASLTAVAC